MSIDEVVLATEEEAPRPSTAATLGLLLATSVVLGGLAAMSWQSLVPLPSYTILADGSATITDSQLTQFFASDAWFTMGGLLVGSGIGLITWVWARHWGWPAAVVAFVLAVVSGLVCWQVGQLLGPGPFDERLAAAKVGDSVRIALQLRSWVALAAWGWAAVVTMTLVSALVPLEEASTRIIKWAGRSRNNREGIEPHEGEVNEMGVVVPVAEEPSSVSGQG